MTEKEIKKKQNGYIEKCMLVYFENHPYMTYNDFKKRYNEIPEHSDFGNTIDDKIINARKRKLQREGSLLCESEQNGKNGLESKKIVKWENWQ